MIVVSNTSPIINLACIGQLDLLRQIYGQITIPDAVFTEITVNGIGQPGAEEVPRLPWMILRPVIQRPLVNVLRLELDAGEAEALACALELPADLILTNTNSEPPTPRIRRKGSCDSRLTLILSNSSADNRLLAEPVSSSTCDRTSRWPR